MTAGSTSSACLCPASLMEVWQRAQRWIIGSGATHLRSVPGRQERHLHPAARLTATLSLNLALCLHQPHCSRWAEPTVLGTRRLQRVWEEHATGPGLQRRLWPSPRVLACVQPGPQRNSLQTWASVQPLSGKEGPAEPTAPAPPVEPCHTRGHGTEQQQGDLPVAECRAAEVLLLCRLVVY